MAPDYDDDWMNPKPFQGWTRTIEQDPKKVEYIIERATAVPVTGNVSYIIEWRFWAKYETREERDKALKELAAEHLAWHLRARERRPYWEHRGIYPPATHLGINQ